MERLQKVIAASGHCSRRAAESKILEGKVKVNGVICNTLGTKVSKKDEVIVDGKYIEQVELVYYLLNKPLYYVSTSNDEHDRKKVIDLIATNKRIYPVGRLDYNTSGALLLTNDGELTNKLIHPKGEIEKVYQVRVKGLVKEASIKKLCNGIVLDGVKTKKAKFELISYDKTHESTLFLLTITEGKNHQVRRMCQEVGHEVKKLKRLSFATLKIDGLAEGEYRLLKPYEIVKLRELVK